ncbi:MAG TPA: FG-GAP-like repeat-containing protein, partial [Thermoanaerobaculia bacterium]|nr:FG-GAP-like repeat-containing protein [Thermoanaerobaculia bacterium]
MSPEERAERLASLRTLGKALYENPATQYDAVDVLAEALALSGGAARDRVNLGLALLRAGREDEGVAALEKAQQQDPSLPHPWFNLGIAAKRSGDPERAVAQLERMAELVPDEPITRYNLGVLYKLQGRTDEALAAFERAAELDPYLAGARFQLAAAYRQAGRAEDARRANTEFRELKRLQADDAVGEDLEWSYYSELHDPLDARPAVVAPAAEPKLAAQEVTTLPGGGAKATGASTGLAVLDADGDRTPDLLAWNAAGARLFLAGREAAASGLERVAGITAVAAGDFDDDGFPDLAVTTTKAAHLWHNRGTAGDGPRFVRHAPPLPEPAGRAYRDAVWLDFDQDYDLDLFLLGAESALLRNVGTDDTGATRFEDRSDAFPFVDGEAISGSVVDSVADGRGMDLAVAYADRAGTLYRDQLGARYVAEDLPALPAGARDLTAFDLDDDGWTDLAARGPGGPLLLANARGPGFEAISPAAGLPAGAPFAFVDLENRGVGELVAGGRLARNRGEGQFATATPLAALGSPLALASADFDADGRADLASLDADGRLRLRLNRTETANHWLRIDLVGKKNLHLAPGAEVEVRAGTLYQKRIYHGVPLTVGLGPHAEVDAVRITWPNGLIQNETRQPAGVSASYEEAQRLSGSCPMVFTWNGRGMEFIGDVLGVAPLGAAAGDGVYFQVDHDEVLAIGAEQLVPRDGVYDVRMTEELREVGYVDHLRLLAVDHPAEVEVLHNDKFKGPPYPEFKLWGVEPSRRAAPTAAVNQNGDDVLPALLHRDRTYAAGVACNGSGISTPHTLTLDFAGAGEVAEAANVLVLHGWTDWADGSTFMATAQAPAGPALHLPVLRMRGESGEWETVVADPGVPAGKPKTIVVELPGWLSSSREIRIESSMCVYWDDVALAAADREPTVRVTEMDPLRADLRFRGFSSVEVHPRRLQPEKFTYADLRTEAPWNPTRGVYTRFGDVRELLSTIDDRLMVFGAGDELALAFDASEPPALPDGWRRDFLLVVDGWAKDGDSNTAYGT